MNPTKPCRKCGATDRYPDGHCRACARTSGAAWRAANAEKKKAMDKAWVAANPEKIKAKSARYWRRNAAVLRPKSAEKQRRYRAQNPAKVAVTNKAWIEKNRARKNAHTHNRKAAAGGRLSLDLIPRLFALQRGMCPCCELPLGQDYHLDHKMPLALGGLNIDSNMQLLRAGCNMQKHAKHPVDFMQSRGFLL